MNDTTKKDFESRIHANPKDDDLRLVFADYLEEQGDVDRASVIRLQCEAAKLASWERRYQEATHHANALIQLRGHRWRQAELPLLDGVEWTTFERGFVSTARVKDVATLYKHDEAIGLAKTVWCVELPALDEATTPRPEGSLKWLTTLRVTNDGNDWSSNETSSLLSVPRTIELKQLWDGQDLGWFSDWLSREVSQSSESRLSSLEIQGHHTVGLTFVRELIESLEELAARDRAMPLRSLRLGTAFIDYDSGYFEDPTFGQVGAELIAGASSIRDLEAIDVSRQRIGEEGLAVVSRSLPKLRDLVAKSVGVKDLSFLHKERSGASFDRVALSGNAIGDDGAHVLATTSRMSELAVCELDTCEIGSAGVLSITNSPFWDTLRHLELGRNPLDVAGLEALSAARPPPLLHTLGLADIDLDVDKATRMHEALAAMTWLGGLFSLDLSRNTLRTLEPLRPWFADAKLRKLSLSRAALDGAACEQLAELMPRLWYLDLSFNPIGGDGLALLTKNDAPELGVLDLRSCDLTGRALEPLLEKKRLPRLHELRLAGNALHASAVSALMSSPLLDHLRVLDLSKASLDEDAAAVIARSPRLANLARLNLRGNDFKESGLLALAHSKYIKSVGKILLSGDQWRFPQATRDTLVKAFGPSWWWSREEYAEETNAEPAEEDDD